MCRLSWFLDPGGWSKANAVGLYFIFPGICTLSLIAHCQQSMQGHFVAQWLTFARVKVNSICRFFNAHIFSEVDWCARS
ncbi:hypothetical protein STEG23_031890 [Scotinomys teguina]